MARSLTPRQSGTDRRQAAGYYRRERRRSRVDPTHGLFRTHRFTEAQGAISTGTVFPGTLLSPVTFRVSVNITSTSAQGSIFGFGDATRGVSISVIDVGDAIEVVAGGAAGNGVTLTVPGAFGQLRSYEIVVAIIPGTGSVLLWVDGKLIGSEQSANGTFGGGWTSAVNGGIGPLTGSSVVGELSVYVNQRPRQSA